MNVYGSGIALEYCSVVPVIWHTASTRTSASSGLTIACAKFASASALAFAGIDDSW